MSLILKAPDHSAPLTSTVQGISTSRTIYGPSSTLDLAAILRRTTVLTDPDATTGLEVVSQPASGRVIPRSDGRLTIDLEDVRTTAPLSFTYRKTNGAQTTDVDVTLNLTDDGKLAGWSKGNWFRPEIGSDKKCIVRPGANTRPIYVASAGISDAVMAVRDPNISSAGDVNTNYLRNSNAYDAGGSQLPYKWGEREDVAVDLTQGLRIWNDERGRFKSPFWLANRGDTFASAPSCSGLTGTSDLHPAFIGAYGVGAEPAYAGKAPGIGSSFPYGIVIQDFEYARTMEGNNAFNICVWNFKANGSNIQPGDPYQVTFEGVGHLCWGIAVGRGVILDGIPAAPGGSRWHYANNDRTSGFYASKIIDHLVEDMFLDQIGWGQGYRGDRDGAFPKSPEDRSHAFYLQGNNFGATIRRIGITNPCFSGIQARSGAIMEDVFVVFANAGLLLGNFDGAGVNFNNPSGDNWGPYSYGRNLVVTEAGQKDFYDDVNSQPNGANGYITTLALGIEAAGVNYALKRALVLHSGDADRTPISSLTDIGTVGRVSANSETRTFYLSKNDGYPVVPEEVVGYNWSRTYNPDVNTENLDTAALDNATVGKYIDTWKSTAGSSVLDLAGHLRAEVSPVDRVIDMLGYFLTPGGFLMPTVRSTAETVIYAPEADGSSPGRRSDMVTNWSTGDLPGTVAGDSFDLDGHDPYWNQTPANAISTVTFGKGGGLQMLGGGLRPTNGLNVDNGGNRVSLDGGARLQTPGHSGGGTLTLRLNEGFYRNTGLFSHDADVQVLGLSEAVLAEAGGTFRLTSGSKLTIGGRAVAGVDGPAGTASVIFETGSVVEFSPAARALVTGMRSINTGEYSGRIMPNLQDIVSTVGGSATVMKVVPVSNTSAYYVLDEIAGAIVDGETLTTPNPTVSRAMTYTAAILGGEVGVLSSPSIRLGDLTKFRSGEWGFDDPAVTGNLTLGGTLRIDAAPLPGGYSKEIISGFDSVTGSFDTLDVQNLGTRDATVTVSATGVMLAIGEFGTGTGLVNGA